MPNPNGVFLSHRPGPRAPMLHSCPIFRTSGPSPEARAASLLKRRRLGGKALFGGAAKNHRRAVLVRSGAGSFSDKVLDELIKSVGLPGQVTYTANSPYAMMSTLPPQPHHHAISTQSARNQHAISTTQSVPNQYAINTQTARNQHAISTQSAPNQHAISTQSTPRNQNAISTQSARNPHAISTHSALFSPVAFVSDAAVRRFFCEVQYA